MHIVSARDKSVTDPQGARSLERVSYTVSTVGIVVSVIIVAVYLGVALSVDHCDDYVYDGRCYGFMSCEYTQSRCEDFVHSAYDGICCYYDCDDYVYDGKCYSHKSCEYTQSECEDDFLDSAYDGDCCYYNN